MVETIDAVNKVLADKAPAAPAYVVPGSRRAVEIEHDKAQVGFVQDAKDGLDSTTAAGLARTVTDEAPGIYTEITGEEPSFGIANAPARVAAAAMSLVGLRAGEKDYDKTKEYEKLTAGIPYEFHDEIMDNDNIAAAQRARTRVLTDLDRGRRMSQQDSGGLVSMAASLFDVDLPLMLMSGGAYGSARAARIGLKAEALLGKKAGMRSSSALMGINAGAQGGAVVGGIDAYNRESVAWQDMAAMTFQSALLGGGLGTALTGEARAAYKAAQDDFHAKVAQDDPSLNQQLDVDRMGSVTDNIKGFVPGEGSTAGALQVNGIPGTPSLSSTLTDPAGTISPTSAQWIDGAAEWRHSTGWQDRKDAVADEFWTKVALNPAANLTTSFYKKLYTSKSSVANWMAGVVFESPSGLGRGSATAATRAEVYHKKIMQPISRGVEPAANEYAKETGTTFKGSGFGISQQGLNAFNREVMLDLNDRSLGRTTPRQNQHVLRAADAYDTAGKEAHLVGQGRPGETSLDGFENIPTRNGHTPMVWSGAQIMQAIRQGRVTQQAIVDALAAGYHSSGVGAVKDAVKIAKAVVNRAITKDADIDGSVWSLLSGDGQEFLRQSLELSGTPAGEIDAILDRLVGSKHDKSKEGFAKMRNEIDMRTHIKTLDGSTMQIVDLLDMNLHAVWQRYSRRMSGSSALARVGIINRAERSEMISAMRAEQRALGEEAIEGDLVEAMLSHFNGGPVHGYAMGQTNEGIGVPLSMAKKATSLALLEKLGVTQLAETGAIMAQQGLQNWALRGPMAMFDKDLKAGNKAMLDDMAFFTGRIGEDHIHFAPYLDLDDATLSDSAHYIREAQRFLSNSQWVQGYTSLFNQVKGWQQQTAALGISDKVFRVINDAVTNKRAYTTAERKRLMDDFGIDQTMLSELEDLVHTGKVVFKTRGNHTYVDRLNMQSWDAALADEFASSITRGVNQSVQRTMAGEEDAWLHTQAGSIMMHLKTFPLAAIQKQVIRNGRHMDGQGLATLMYGMATAYVAVRIKDAIDGKERTGAEYAKLAFNYSNMTGFIPMAFDPLMTVVGLEDMRFNQYGPYTDLTPPIISVANNARRVPGALADTLTGTADWYDEQALKAIPFAGTYGISRMFERD